MLKRMLLIAIIVVAVGGLASCEGFDMRHEAWLELSEAIIDQGHDFLVGVIFPIAMPNVPIGELVDISQPDELADMLRLFTQHDWDWVFSHLDGDELSRIRLLHGAVQR